MAPRESHKRRLSPLFELGRSLSEPLAIPRNRYRSQMESADRPTQRRGSGMGAHATHGGPGRHGAGPKHCSDIGDATATVQPGSALVLLTRDSDSLKAFSGGSDVSPGYRSSPLSIITSTCSSRVRRLSKSRRTYGPVDRPGSPNRLTSAHQGLPRDRRAAPYHSLCATPAASMNHARVILGFDLHRESEPLDITPAVLSQ